MKYRQYIVGAVVGGVLVYIFAAMMYTRQKNKYAAETKKLKEQSTGVPIVVDAPHHSEAPTEDAPQEGAGERGSY